MPVPDRRRRLTAFVVAMAVLIATPLVVVATDAFNDVPNENVHHDDITWLRDADVTRGCNPPTNDRFCPGDPVLRQQMASFMRRLAENKVVDAATAVEAEHATTAETAGDADTLDGIDSTGFVLSDERSTAAWIIVNVDGSILRQSGGFTVTKGGAGSYLVDHPDLDESSAGFVASSFNRPGGGISPAVVTAFCNTSLGCNVRVYDLAGVLTDHDFALLMPFVDADGLEIAGSGPGTVDPFGPDNE